MDTTTHCYVAYAPCGCMAGAIVDDPTQPKRTAAGVAEFLRDGNRIERQPHPVTIGGNCQHTPRWGRPAPAEPV